MSESCFRCNSNCNCWTIEIFWKTRRYPAHSSNISVYAVSFCCFKLPLARIWNTFHGHVNCWCVAGQSKLKTKTMTQHQCKASKTWWIISKMEGSNGGKFPLMTPKDGRISCRFGPPPSGSGAMSTLRHEGHGRWIQGHRDATGVESERHGKDDNFYHLLRHENAQKNTENLKSSDCQDTSLLRPGLWLHICAPVAQSVQPCFFFLWPTFSPMVFHIVNWEWCNFYNPLLATLIYHGYLDIPAS